MTNSKNSSISEYSFTDNDSHIDTDLTNTSTGNTHLLNQSMILVHQQEPEFFDILILKNRVHVVVNKRGST